MDLVKFLMWAAWAAARRKLNPVLLGSFNVAPLEFVSKESTDPVMEKDSFWLNFSLPFWLKLESRVEETLPMIGPSQCTMLLLLYAALFGGPLANAWSLATFVGEGYNATLVQLADLCRVARRQEFALESRGKRTAGTCLVTD